MFNLENTKQFREELISEFYANRDKSHGVDHVRKVRSNVIHLYHNLTYDERNKIQIATSMLNSWNIDIEVFIALCAELHDVTDHKYVKDELSKKRIQGAVDHRLIKYLAFNNAACNCMWQIIDNISFSVQLRGERADLGIWNGILYLVSDADKLESLGEISFRRMVIYTIQIEKIRDIEGIYLHIFNHTKKLLRLYPSMESGKWVYIKYAKSRELAKALHYELFNIITNKKISYNIIMQYL